MSEDKRMRLNIGAGDKHLPGWINTDIRPCGEKTVDIRNIPYEKNVFDEIYACHVLDHLSRKDIDIAIKECYRVLKNHGTFRVAVVDFEKIVKIYNAGLNLEELWGSIVGGWKNEYDRHGCIFDFKLLKNYLEKHGFYDIKRYNWRDFLPEGFEDNSCAAIPKYDVYGYAISLNVVATK